jgi:hypothetical protein
LFNQLACRRARTCVPLREYTAVDMTPTTDRTCAPLSAVLLLFPLEFAHVAATAAQRSQLEAAVRAAIRANVSAHVADSIQAVDIYPGSVVVAVYLPTAAEYDRSLLVEAVLGGLISVQLVAGDNTPLVSASLAPNEAAMTSNSLVGPIAGGVAGGVACLVAVVVGIWAVRRRRHQRQQKSCTASVVGGDKSMATASTASGTTPSHIVQNPMFVGEALAPGEYNKLLADPTRLRAAGTASQAGRGNDSGVAPVRYQSLSHSSSKRASTDYAHINTSQPRRFTLEACPPEIDGDEMLPPPPAYHERGAVIVPEVPLQSTSLFERSAGTYGKIEIINNDDDKDNDNEPKMYYPAHVATHQQALPNHGGVFYDTASDSFENRTQPRRTTAEPPRTRAATLVSPPAHASGRRGAARTSVGYVNLPPVADGRSRSHSATAQNSRQSGERGRVAGDTRLQLQSGQLTAAEDV